MKHTVIGFGRNERKAEELFNFEAETLDLGHTFHFLIQRCKIPVGAMKYPAMRITSKASAQFGLIVAEHHNLGLKIVHSLQNGGDYLYITRRIIEFMTEMLGPVQFIRFFKDFAEFEVANKKRR